MPMEISKAATASTSSTSSSAVIEDYYITPDNNNNNNNYNDNDDDEETSTTTDDDDDDSHYELYDDNSSLSTSGTEDEDRPTNNLVEHHHTDDTNNISYQLRKLGNNIASSSSLDVNTSLDNLLAEEEILHEYNDGDLQTLNELVNKLHEADVARRVKLEQQQQHLCYNERRADDYEVEDYYDEDDDDDEDDDSYSDHYQHYTSSRKNKPTTTTADLPSEMPLHPPSFSPLLLERTNNHQHRQLSISSVDSSLHGPSIEIVPTSQISSILPLWNASWMEERREWAMLCQLREEERMSKRERESVGSSNNNNDERRRRYRMLRRNNTDLPSGGNSGDNNTNVRRNRSEPSPRSPSTTTHHSKNRYGKPTPITTTPNPIVTKSSKKIHRRHARYALTAGMMLGVREGVGGANGVECELEAKLWEESERKEMKGSGGNVGDSGGNDGGGSGGQQQQQQQPSQRVEVVMGPLKVVTSVENEHDCCGIITATVLCPQSNGRSITTTNTTTTTTNNNKHTKEDDKQAHHHHQQDDKHYHDNYLTQQCERISKYNFSPSTFYLGSNTSEPLPHKYKFKVYAPVVFQRIRTLFGVEKQTFLHSICGKFNLYEFASNAKSGQFFFYSHDGRYMIKTLTYTEQKFLRLILPSYYRHLTRYPHTFLTHFYGLYRVCMPIADNTRLHFVIMRSVFHSEKKIDRVWDLKGSTVGRKSEEGESVAKDVDILEEGKKLRFQNGSEREAFLKQLEVDAAFLATLGIMDYSLLLGLHNGCNDACYGGGGGSPVDNTTPTNSVRKRLNTGDSAIGGGGVTELPMTNTPHRRNVLKRATSHGATINNNNNNGSSPPKPPPPPPPRVGGSSPTKSSPFPLSSSNPITSMPDLGIQGGTPLRPETYYCGIIDILQYYNARKMGETVIKKAAGHADNISCVDPETYGKRFVKFISDLVE